ncbi:MAG: hypothetical protein Q9195_006486 [Heterodermia aff. obscurata]
MLFLVLLHSLVAAAFLAHLGHASPMLQQRNDDDDIDYSLGNKGLPQYTAIGDAYAAGVGYFDSIDGDKNCRRTTGSYPSQFVNSYGAGLGITSFNFLACAGADTEATTTQIESGSSHLDLPAIGHNFGNPNLVSISVGSSTGNLFGSVIDACVLGLLNYGADSSDYLNPCTGAWYNAYVTLYGLGQSLPALFEKARTVNRAKDQVREVYVLGYPRFYNTEEGRANCPPLADMPTPSLGGVGIEMNGVVNELNKVLKKACAEGGARFVDVDAKFEGHRVCDREHWFQTSHQAKEDIFHPNEKGYEAIMEALSEAVWAGSVYQGGA